MKIDLFGIMTDTNTIVQREEINGISSPVGRHGILRHFGKPCNLIGETWGDSGDLTIEIDAEEYEFEDFPEEEDR